MGKSKPPAHSTFALRARLRLPVALCAALAGALASAPLHAKSAPIRVLVAATVADRAHDAMSVALWQKYVTAYVGAEVLLFDGAAAPTLEDCRKAGADYLLTAPFDLRPRLPGLANATGRSAARTQLRAVNCITGNTILERSIDFESDPPSSAGEGDFERAPEIAWARGLPAALAKTPLPFERIARVIAVNAPVALVDIRHAGVRPGDGLRDFARSDRSARSAPIDMTVTQVFDRYVEVLFSVNGDRPGVGDLVEPITGPASPQPGAAAK